MTDKELFNKKFNGVNKRYLYIPKEYDERGIDYTRYIKLRHQSVEKINSFYTTDGWHILYYLMSRANQCETIYISKNTIIKDLHSIVYGHEKNDNGNNKVKIESEEKIPITKYMINKTLKLLQDNKVIYSDKDLSKIKLDETMKILILYNREDYINENGFYIPIPIDFIHKAVIELSNKEFSMLTYLCMRFRYHQLQENVNQETSEVYYTLNEWHYAFPKQEDIANIIGVNRGVVNHIAKSLSNKGYMNIIPYIRNTNIINKNTNKNTIKNENYRYEIELMKRYEYMKYLILDQNETYSTNDKKIIDEYKKQYKNKFYEKLIEDGQMNIINKYKKMYIENTQMERIKICFNELEKKKEEKE